MILTSCSPLTSVATSAVTDVLTGGDGPKLEAQVGRENTKQIVGNQSTIQAGNNSSIDASRPRLRSENVDSVTINELPAWVLLSLILSVAVGVIGWMLPTPKQMWKNFKERK